MNTCIPIAGAGDVGKGTEQILHMLTTIDSKVEEIRSEINQHRKPNLSVHEVGQLTGRSDYTIRRWVSEGKLAAIRVQGAGPRGRLLIPRAELDRLI